MGRRVRRLAFLSVQYVRTRRVRTYRTPRPSARVSPFYSFEISILLSVESAEPGSAVDLLRTPFTRALASIICVFTSRPFPNRRRRLSETFIRESAKSSPLGPRPHPPRFGRPPFEFVVAVAEGGLLNLSHGANSQVPKYWENRVRGAPPAFRGTFR